eukprot:COSAG03_NODE_1761_length_3558_cov_194.899393_3_plen_116_part_00
MKQATDLLGIDRTSSSDLERAGAVMLGPYLRGAYAGGDEPLPDGTSHCVIYNTQPSVASTCLRMILISDDDLMIVLSSRPAARAGGGAELRLLEPACAERRCGPHPPGPAPLERA